jgi:hypothetical protein
MSHMPTTTTTTTSSLRPPAARLAPLLLFLLPAREALATQDAHRDGAVVAAWNQVATEAAVKHDGFQDFAVNLRALAMMHLAIHDALNAIVPLYDPYAFAARRPHADPLAAVSQAAHDVLVLAYSAQAAVFDAELERWLARVPGGRRKAAGVELGREVARAIVALRAGDGLDAPGAYQPRGGPGDYAFVPPFDFVFRPAVADARPFALRSGEQFRPPPPPALTDPAYAAAFEEVKSFGRADSSVRSDDQTHAAAWWAEFAEIGWNRIANTLVRERRLSMHRAARLFALLEIGIMDAYVAVWNAKRFYDRWRPYTAIRAADTDGNPATEPDAGWESFLVNPPIQEYPSAHAIESAAAAEILVAALGADVSFESTSTSAPADRPTRRFAGLRAAAAEAADSRVMAGIHFRYACDAGLEAGRELGRYVVRHQLRHRKPAGRAGQGRGSTDPARTEAWRSTQLR